MRLRLSLLLLTGLMLGCGGSSGVAPVSGKITMGGKPLAKAKVNFQPIAEGNNMNPGAGSYGETNEEGIYTLKVVGQDKSGAVVGPHRVAITKMDKPGGDPNDDKQRGGRNIIPPKYNRDTTLKFTVPSGGTSEANFDLDAK